MSKSLAGKILIIDDNIQILDSLKMLLKYEFKEVFCFKDPSVAVEGLQKNPYDVVLLDMNFKDPNNTGKEGLFWLDEILKNDPLAVVILITAYGDITLAVEAIKKGATDFITKPWNADKLIITLKNAYELHQNKLKVKKLENNQTLLQDEIDKFFKMFTGLSPSIKEVYRIVEKVANTDANVLIYGENGTGKELIARELHRKSNRANEIFVGVDLGSISESLFESELFGHVKGAYTDAKNDRAGRFEIASGGTLFLDEISNLPLSHQSKLLTVLQSRHVIRMGSNKSIPIDIRLISATNKNLEDLIGQCLFREDLYYRINTIKIHLPPLRERKEDILGLAEFFINQFGMKYGKLNIHLSTKASDALLRHTWPGNIRELKHTIEKAIILCESDSIQLYDLGLKTIDTVNVHESENQSLIEIEKVAIINAIQKSRGNLSMAAKSLKISRTTLYSKIQKYNL